MNFKNRYHICSEHVIKIENVSFQKCFSYDFSCVFHNLFHNVYRFIVFFHMFIDYQCVQLVSFKHMSQIVSEESEHFDVFCDVTGHPGHTKNNSFFKRFLHVSWFVF
jgi:hypothetical protein